MDQKKISTSGFVQIKKMLVGTTLGVFDLKRCCADCSVYDIKELRMLSNYSRGTLMSYNDCSAQLRFKSNTTTFRVI